MANGRGEAEEDWREGDRISGLGWWGAGLVGGG